jgi:hypothetical protein
MGAFEEVSKVSPYGVALSMAFIGRRFEEVYNKPRRCGHKSQSCLRNKGMKESVNAGNTLIDG